MNFLLFLLPLLFCIVNGKNAPQKQSVVPAVDDDVSNSTKPPRLTSILTPFPSKNKYVVHHTINNQTNGGAFEFDEQEVESFIGAFFFEDFEEASLIYSTVVQFESFLVRSDLPASARILKPGEVCTMDVRPGRITINLDQASRITKIRFF